MKEKQWTTAIYKGRKFNNYQVSDEGEVKSLNYNHTGKPKVLCQRIDRLGYHTIFLCADGKRYGCKVHFLVKNSFDKEVPEGKTSVDHINVNRGDNRLSNLRWATQKEQLNFPDQNRQRCPKKILHKKGRKKQEYKSIAEASRVTGINRNAIIACCNGIYSSVKKNIFQFL